MNRLVGAALVLVALSGCSTVGEKITRLKPGVHADQVIAVLGQPDQVLASDGHKVFLYQGRRTRHSIWKTNYTVLFKDGSVVAFGRGLAGEDSAHDLVIVPPAGRSAARP